MASRKPKIAKQTSPVHVIVPDTNVLWHGDKTLVVDPDFDIFWETHKSSLPMELAVPDVVLGELNFQQATSALKRLETITTALDEISGIVGCKHSTKLGEEDIKRQVATKIDRWIRARSASVIKTPINVIDWGKVIQSAIWRLPPFTYDPKKPEIEKGFRDALILETLMDTARRSHLEHKNVVFLCKDQLLRTTAIDLLKDQPNAICFESLADFEGYIKLTQEELTSTFITQIQNRARSRFYTRGDDSCLYLKKNVPGLILEKFANELEIEPQSNQLTGTLSGGERKWLHKSTSRRIGSATFVRLVQPRTYHWSSRVSAYKLFNEAVETGSGTYSESQNARILRCIFDVKWSADVKADGRFLDLDVNEITLAERTLENATPENIEKWGLSALTVPW